MDSRLFKQLSPEHQPPTPLHPLSFILRPISSLEAFLFAIFNVCMHDWVQTTTHSPLVWGMIHNQTDISFSHILGSRKKPGCSVCVCACVCQHGVVLGPFRTEHTSTTATMSLWLLQLQASRLLLPHTESESEEGLRKYRTQKYLFHFTSWQPILTEHQQPPLPEITKKPSKCCVKLLSVCSEDSACLKYAAWVDLHLPVTFSTYLPFHSEPGQAACCPYLPHSQHIFPVYNNKELPPRCCCCCDYYTGPPPQSSVSLLRKAAVITKQKGMSRGGSDKQE